MGLTTVQRYCAACDKYTSVTQAWPGVWCVQLASSCPRVCSTQKTLRWWKGRRACQHDTTQWVV